MVADGSNIKIIFSLFSGDRTGCSNQLPLCLSARLTLALISKEPIDPTYLLIREFGAYIIGPGVAFIALDHPVIIGPVASALIDPRAAGFDRSEHMDVDEEKCSKACK